MNRRVGMVRPRMAWTALIGLGLALTSQLAAPPPAAAAWERTLTIDFYADVNYGDGRGRVTSDDGGIDCSYDRGVRSGDCSEHYILPDFQATHTVKLTLDPGVGSFVCVQVQFGCQNEGATPTVDVDFARASGGDVTKSPSFTRALRKIIGNWEGPGTVQIDSGSACTPPTNYEFCFQRKYGDSVTLSAVPNAGKVFSYMHGTPCSESSRICEFELTEDMNVFALFGQVELTFDATGSGELCLSTSGTNCFIPPVSAWEPVGDSFAVEAAPASGWQFVRWNSGPCAGQDRACSFTVQSTTTIVATFERNATPPPTPKPTPRPTPKPTPRPTPKPTPRFTPTPTPTASPRSTSTPRPSASTAVSESAPPAESSGAVPSASARAESSAPTDLPGATAAEPATSIAPRTLAPTEGPVAPGAGSAAPGASFMPLVLLALLAAIVTVLLGFAVGRRAKRQA